MAHDGGGCGHEGCGHDHGEGCGGCGGGDDKLRSRMSRVRHKILVLSGKGGVGKSTVAVNLAVSLSLAGKRVGLLDVDLHGPSVPTMLGIEGSRIETEGEEFVPLEIGDLKVLSIGLLLGDRDDAVIWRGPMKIGVIKQFLQDVAWGDLDYLVIDAPPGTGDEPLSVCQYLPDADGAVIVTTPQKVAVADVRKSVMFCRQIGMPILGVVENMSGFACPKCGEVSPIFKTGGGEIMAQEMEVRFLGRIPLDPRVGESGDAGAPFIHHQSETETAKAFGRIVRPLLELSSNDRASNAAAQRKENGPMRIAIPMAEGKLCLHFGHCETFALIDVDEKTKKPGKREDVVPPPHEPGLLPKWLAERGATHVIAGGMGARAKSLFGDRGIEVVTGAPVDKPETLVQAFLAGTLVTGENTCDH